MSSNLVNNIQKLCESLGRSNKATYAVVAIAITKGIFRPIFTMSDKHENPQTKKYTAIREGLTEVVAIPTYIGVAKIAEIVAANLKISNKEDVTIAKHNANFLGVCFAAAIVIPVVTSVIINPLMKMFHCEAKQNNLNKIGDKGIVDLKGEVNIKKTVGPSDFGVNKKRPYTPYSQIYAESFVPARQFSMKVGGLW